MDIIDCIGNTPFLYLKRISRIAGANIYAKIESYNPTASIKDRVAHAYLQSALDRNAMNANHCVIEVSTGHLDISLAHMCAKMDLRLMLCMPSSVNRLHYNYLRDLGVHIFLTAPEKGIQGALEEAAFQHQDTWGSFRPKPFINPDGPTSYYNGLGNEIVDASEKEELSLDAFICGVESGATFSGVGKRLREEQPSIFLGATEIAESPTITAENLYILDSEMSYNSEKSKDQKPVFDRNLVSQSYTVSKQDALRAQKRLLSLEGIAGGILSGANIHAALLLAQDEKFQGKNIFTIVHDNKY